MIMKREVRWVSDTRCTVYPDWYGIRPNTDVDTGYSDTTLTAPPDKGLYTLYEEVYPMTNTHRSWVWIREGNTI